MLCRKDYEHIVKEGHGVAFAIHYPDWEYDVCTDKNCEGCLENQEREGKDED